MDRSIFSLLRHLSTSQAGLGSTYPNLRGTNMVKLQPVIKRSPFCFQSLTSIGNSRRTVVKYFSSHVVFKKLYQTVRGLEKGTGFSRPATAVR